MLDKKKDKDQKNPEREALEKQVDAMMDPKRPDGGPAPASAAPAASVPNSSAVSDLPDLSDVSGVPAGSGLKTAPELPDRLRKQLGVDAKPAKPITIKKLDELTERIVGPNPPGGEPGKKQEPEKTADGSEDEDITEQSTDLEDVRTDAAVDDIVAYEGDVMLAIADSTAAERNRRAEAEAGAARKKGNFSAFLWFLVFAIAVVALLLLALLVTGGNVHSLKP